MRWKQTLIPTVREVPKEAEATSHQLMLKAGYIRKLSSGVYSYLPLGFRVLQRICRVIRQEMQAAGAVELLLPALHPAEIWKASGRYESLGEDKISFTNRSGQEFVLGPTHEEIITELAGGYLRSHHDLPKILYQIQNKFRDELRPRFGIIRTKEFIMKDAYSFDADMQGLQQSYQKMYDAYEKILKALEIPFDIVAADPGIMGGKVSHEFMVRSPYGEDRIVACSKCKTVVSRDIAGRKIEEPRREEPQSSKPVEFFDTPNLRTIQEMSGRFKLKPEAFIKTIIYMGTGNKVIAACVRGDHEVHEGKLRNLAGGQDLRLASAPEILEITGAPIGFAGPVGLKKAHIVCDADLLKGKDYVTGANQKDQHIRHVNLFRDFEPAQIGDIRYVQEGDRCSSCGTELEISTAMEVGHVFQLGTRYSESLHTMFKDKDDQDKPFIMGCYGIGVNRVMAAIVEKHNDSKGIKWPVSVAPFCAMIITVNQADSTTREAAETLLGQLENAGIECLYDDRDERAGVKFNDADLIGIPFQVVLGPRNLKENRIEIKERSSGESQILPIEDCVSFLTARI